MYTSSNTNCNSPMKELIREVQKVSCHSLGFSLNAKTSWTPKEDDVYAFHVVSNDASDPVVATSLSNNSIKLCTLDDLRAIASLKGPSSTIAGIKFSQSNLSLLYSAYENGNISIWDTRENVKNPSKSMQDEERRPVLSFDVDTSENFICIGTELIQEDAYLLFWDCRMCKLLGGYWDCHTDDVTQVKFHPHKKDLLASSSVDGLVNVYDVSLPTEDDAIQCTLNADVSLEKLRWLPLSQNNTDVISTVDHMGDVCLWNVEDAVPCWSYRKDKIMESQKGQVTVDYVIDTFQLEEDVYIMTGSSTGSCHIWKCQEDMLILCSDLAGGHNDVIRSLCWLPRLRFMLTAGEDGCICAWKQCSEGNSDVSSHLKVMSTMKSEMKPHSRLKPY